MAAYLHPDPCPCCEAGPLLFVACASCGAVIAWCGEQDYPIGRIDSGRLVPFGLGEKPDWARRACPACGADVAALGHARAEELRSVGLAPEGWSQSG